MQGMFGAGTYSQRSLNKFACDFFDQRNVVRHFTQHHDFTRGQPADHYDTKFGTLWVDCIKRLPVQSAQFLSDGGAWLVGRLNSFAAFFFADAALCRNNTLEAAISGGQEVLQAAAFDTDTLARVKGPKHIRSGGFCHSPIRIPASQSASSAPGLARSGRYR